jgi:hypothetical protein
MPSIGIFLPRSRSKPMSPPIAIDSSARKTKSIMAGIALITRREY